MRWFRWLLPFTVVLVVPAAAQIPPGIIRAIPPTVATQPGPVSVPACATVELCKAALDKAIADRNAARDDARTAHSRLDETLEQLRQMTALGGSLVHAYCASETLSKNTSGATEDCEVSGYRCASVEGTCYRQCNVSTECAGGFTCDTGAHTCVKTG